MSVLVFCNFFMSSQPDIVGKGIVLGCPVLQFVRSFVRSSDLILLPQYLMNVLNSFDKTDLNYILEVNGQRSRSQQAIDVKSCEHHI